MSYELNILLQIVNCDREIFPAFAKFEACITRKCEIQSQVFDWTTIQGLKL